MENNIKKAFESIDVPLDKLDAAIAKGIQPQKKKRWSPFKKGVLAAVASATFILGSGFLSPKMADVLANVPLIGFLYEIETHDAGLYEALADDNKVTLNETVTSNGIAFTIEEIVYDGARMNIIFTMPEYGDVYPLTILVDGERVNNAESLRELEGDGVFRGLWEIRTEETLPDAFDLTIKIHQIGRIKGDWQFTTPIQKVNNNSKELVAGQKGVVDGINFTVESTVTSTTTTTVKVKIEETLDHLHLVEGLLHATITDQNDKPLAVQGLSGSGDESGMVYKYLLEPLADEVTEIRMSYYVVPFLEERVEIVERLASSFPQRISQGKMGEMVITDVIQNGITSTLKFRMESDFVFDDTFTPNYVDITDKAGESFITEYIHAVGPNEYELTYQNNAGQPYFRTTLLPKLKVEKTAVVVIPVK